MPNWQQRVIEEQRELGARLERLLAFFPTDRYHDLHLAEQQRLSRQLRIMTEYREVLVERIAAFQEA